MCKTFSKVIHKKQLEIPIQATIETKNVFCRINIKHLRKDVISKC
ncbi:hypothetical protein ACWNY2_00060 [Candidatus Karelsulcia muelleri]